MNLCSSFSFEKLEVLDISNPYGVNKQGVFMILKSIPTLKKIKVDSRLHERPEIEEMIASSDLSLHLDFISWSMYVFMYLCMYVYMYVCMYVCTWA